MGTVWQQQVFALDAKYNAYRISALPSFRTQYIRRRSQLLQEFTKKEDSAVRRQYLKLRTQLLQKRYGVTYSDQASLRSQNISIRSSRSRISESPDINFYSSSFDDLVNATKQRPYHHGSKGSLFGAVVPTKQAEASRAIVGGNSIADNYAFVGVHHIFDQHKAAVTVVRFANNDRSRLCCSSEDGMLSICNVTASPPSVEAILEGHIGPVTGCDWSISNDLIVSSSSDASIRLWNVSADPPICLRVVRDPSNAPVLCCAFLPANSNMVIAGNGSGMLQVLNISTGIYPRNGGVKIGGQLLSIACESTGRLVWAGNDKGVIASFQIDATGRLIKCRRLTVADNTPITCLSWRAWVSREARDPTLLVNYGGNVCLLRVTDQNGCLQMRSKFPLRQKRHGKQHLIKSTFCPIMSFRQGACIVTGSEDSCVYFLDIERENKAVVNKLQGHACPVLSVAFNYDESLLASSDVQGLVIIWKRDQEVLPTENAQ